MQGDSDRVAEVLRDLDEAADRWAAVLAEAEATTFSVDMGDIHAVVNADGRLVDLVLNPCVTADYTHGELAARINAAFAVLRAQVAADLPARYGGALR